MFHRLFTRSSQGYAQSKEAREREQRAREAFELVLDRLHRLEMAAKELRTEVDAQAVALHKLRGRITGGIRYEKEPDQVAPGDRAALRKLAGIRPGLPYPHT